MRIFQHTGPMINVVPKHCADVVAAAACGLGALDAPQRPLAVA